MFHPYIVTKGTLMFLSFWADKSVQIVKTQIRLEEQSDQDQQCIQFRQHLLDTLLYGKATLIEF